MDQDEWCTYKDETILYIDETWVLVNAYFYKFWILRKDFELYQLK